MTNELFAEVYNDTDRYPTLKDVAAALGVAHKTVKNRASILRRLRAAGRDVPELVSRALSAPERQDTTKRTTETVESPDEPVERLIDRMIRHQERVLAYTDDKAVIDVEITSPGPFLVAGLPDQHLDNPGTNLRKALADAEAIANHPDAYAVSIGDTIDNFIIGRLERARRDTPMTLSDSWRIMEHYIDIIAPSLIAAIGGNHNDWTEMLGGVDVLQRMMKQHGIGAIYDQDEVRVRLNTPSGASFTHLARHIFPGHSRFNAAHGITSWMLERWAGEDVFWGGHTHVAGHVTIEREWMGEHRSIHGIQLPAYKLKDGYAKKRGFRRNMPFLVPAVVHDPRDGSTEWFSDLYKAIGYLDYLRSGRAAAA